MNTKQVPVYLCVQGVTLQDKSPNTEHNKINKPTEIVKLPPLTLTFEPLPGEPPQQSATVFTESGTFVVVDFKPVGHVDLEALLVDLQHTQYSKHRSLHQSKSTTETLLVFSQWVAGLVCEVCQICEL